MEKESRRSLRATIDVVGRDIPDQRLLLIKDENSLIWNLKTCFTDGVEESHNPILESVAELVNSEHPMWEGTPTQLRNEIKTNKSPNHLTRILNVNINKLYSEFHVKYTNEQKHTGRLITLTYAPQSGSQQKTDCCDDQNVAPQADMTTESGSDATGEVTRDGCDDSKTIQPTAVTVDSVKVVDDKVMVCENWRDDRDACNDKNATSTTVAADDSDIDMADEAACVDERDDYDDKNPSIIAADGSGVNTADEPICENWRDDCNTCDD